MKRMFTMLAVAAIAFTACSKEESASVGGDMRIKIDPTIVNPAVLSPAAKATRATDTDFEQGDQIGLRVTKADGTVYLANQQLSYNAADAFFSSSSIWYEDINTVSSLFAYYPYIPGETVPTEFTVQTDQRGEGYAKSDLIIGTKADVNPSSEATGMIFKHKMARLIIDITENRAGSAITLVEVGNVVCAGTVDPETGAVMPKADAVAQTVIFNVATPDKMYYALVMPQSGVKPTITVTTANGKSRTYSLKTVDLKSGENRRLPTIVETTDLKISISGPITGWDDGADLEIDDGSVEPEAPTVEWGGVKYKIVTLKDGRTWMAENLRYVPQGKTVSSDPTSGDGIWNPCGLDKQADPTLVEANGLLYSYPVMLGMSEGFTTDNYANYEGAQGICPDGWHIPTKAEWLKLAGTGSGGLSDPSSPYYDSASGGAPIPSLNADAFNIFTCGYINASTAPTATTPKDPLYNALESSAEAGKFQMAYYGSSTAYKILYNTTDDPTSCIKNVQYYAAMLTYMKNSQGVVTNRMTIAFQGAYGATPVRCIKDAQQ